MNHEIAIHSVAEDGYDPEHVKVTINGREVFRAYMDDLPEEWPKMLRAISVAVKNTADLCDGES